MYNKSIEFMKQIYERLTYSVYLAHILQFIFDIRNFPAKIYSLYELYIFQYTFECTSFPWGIAQYDKCIAAKLILPDL